MTPPSGTGLRAALVPESDLLPAVREDMSAVARKDRGLFEADVQALVRQSLDLDAALRDRYPNDPRWDYLLSTETLLFGVEPHKARGSEVGDVIRKKQSAEDHLRGQLRSHVRIQKWLWVTRGKVTLGRTESAYRRLSKAGIEFVGRRVARGHLEMGGLSGSRPRRRGAP